MHKDYILPSGNHKLSLWLLAETLNWAGKFVEDRKFLFLAIGSIASTWPNHVWSYVISFAHIPDYRMGLEINSIKTFHAQLTIC